MLAKLKAHIESNHLFNTRDRLFLGVSAGVDSMVLAHLLKELLNKSLKYLNNNQAKRSRNYSHPYSFKLPV